MIADAKTKVYGDADPSLTYQVSVGARRISDITMPSDCAQSGSAV